MPGRVNAEGPEARYRETLFTEGALDPFFAALVEELLTLAGTDDAVTFMRQVGRRLAGIMPLHPSETLEGLEAAANQVLLAQRFGWVRLAAVDAGVQICHGALPIRATPRSVNAAGGLLEGLYSAWLNMAGGASHLQARRVSSDGGSGTFELLYSR